MNLVAKEFVAASDPQDPGVLVLSKFAGAARQLDAAVLVNPHDPDDMADAMDRALRMSLAERQDRWRTMWRSIERASPLAWGRSFVAALVRTVSSTEDERVRKLIPTTMALSGTIRSDIGGRSTRIEPGRIM